jgi:hypothetical protein
MVKNFVRYFIELRFKDNRIKFDAIDAEIYFPDEVREKIKWGNVLLNTLSIMIFNGQCNKQ